MANVSRLDEEVLVLTFARLSMRDDRVFDAGEPS